MGIAEYFYPHYSFRRVGDIEEGFFKKHNIKFAILDIDNTLVPYTVKAPTKTAMDFLRRLEAEGVTYGFLSNNNQGRVEKFNNNINVTYVAQGKKPLLFGIKRIMEIMGANRENTVMIGDQVFTDVWVGKRAGILTLLVEPIEEKENFFFKFKRNMEKRILRGYRKDF